MKIYSENEYYKLYQGSMLDMLEVIEPNTIGSIVTDPPYGLTSITKRFGKENSAECQYGKDGSFQRLSRGFMGKEWDGSGIEYNIDTWKKCYEVLKPGGYLLAFGGSRTFHRIACAIEDAGFEIRDTIMWLYGSGFPKSMNIGLAIDKKNGVESKVVGYKGSMMDFRDTGKKQKEISGVDKLSFGQIENSERKQNPIYETQNQWQGWGTALKPSFEPIIVARKPFKGSLVDNVIEYGVGGLNIDECRVGNEERTYKGCGKSNVGFIGGSFENGSKEDIEYNVSGRFPANTILTYDETDFDEVCGGFPNTKSVKSNRGGATNKGELCYSSFNDIEKYECGFNDSGSASRYFYCGKASKKDREEGLEEFKEKIECDRNPELASANMPQNRSGNLRKNTHPTVKPTELMQYLVRLVTPNGGTILDPFNGSGSTGKAVMYENKERNKDYKYIGIDLSEEYLEISKARIEYVCNLIEENEKEDRQMTMFDII